MTIGNPDFCLALYSTGVHFRGELQHVGEVSAQEGGLFMRVVTIFMNDLSWYQQQFNTLKGFEICNCFLLISKQPFMLRIFIHCVKDTAS